MSNSTQDIPRDCSQGLLYPEPSALLTLPTRQASMLPSTIPCGRAGGHKEGALAEGGEVAVASVAVSYEHARHWNGFKLKFCYCFWNVMGAGLPRHARLKFGKKEKLHGRWLSDGCLLFEQMLIADSCRKDSGMVPVTILLFLQHHLRQ